MPYPPPLHNLRDSPSGPPGTDERCRGERAGSSSACMIPRGPYACQTGFAWNPPVSKIVEIPLRSACFPRRGRSFPPARRFHLRTYGCQMNVHDSEKLANLLLHAGWTPCGEPEQADLLLVNTCSIREKAEHRLYSDLGALRAWKAARPGRVLGVGGCVAQQEGDALLRRFAHVDFAFGTHNVRLVPRLVDAALAGERAAR